MSSRAVTFFVRPYNLALSTILQNLTIISHLARKTNGGLIAFNCPREPETQRQLNFGSVTVQEDAASILSKQQQNYKVPISERAALESSTLLYELPLKERGAGLEEVADLAGIRLGKAYKRSNESSVKSSFEKMIGESEKIDRFIDLKVERRRNHHSRRTSKYSNLSAGKEKQLIREMMEFGGFTSGL